MNDTNGQTTARRTARRPHVPALPAANQNLNNARPRRSSAGEHAPPRRWRRGSKQLLMFVTGAMALAVVAALAVVVDRETPVDAEELPRRLAVSTIVAQPVTSYQAKREYTGTIVARRMSQLGFELAGKLTHLRVDDGDRVTAGAVLARLDTERLETNRRQVVARRAAAVAQLNEMVAGPREEDIAAARARVESIQAEVALLTLQTARYKKLRASNATTQDEYEQFAFRLKAREAQFDEARHELKELLNGTRGEQIEAQQAAVAELDAAIADIDVDLQKSQLIAPFDGTVARRLADEGSVVESGQPVFRLVEDRVLEAWIGLPTRVIDDLAEESSQRVKIQGDHFSVTVARRLPEVDPATRTRTVVLEFDTAASQRVVHGQVARLELEETIRAAGYWLPTTALTKGARGLWTALVVEEDSGSGELTHAGSFRVVPRELEVLHTQSDRVLARGTLKPGDRVIADGTHRVVPGQLVRLAK